MPGKTLKTTKCNAFPAFSKKQKKGSGKEKNSCAKNVAQILWLGPLLLSKVKKRLGDEDGGAWENVHAPLIVR